MATYAQHKREELRKEIERRGLRCVQQGKGWRVIGQGVDIVAADLAYIDASQLSPANWTIEPVGG